MIIHTNGADTWNLISQHVQRLVFPATLRVAGTMPSSATPHPADDGGCEDNSLETEDDLEVWTLAQLEGCGFQTKNPVSRVAKKDYAWRQTMRRRNVASDTNVAAPPTWWKCDVKQCGVEMWRHAQMWWQSEMWRQTIRRQNVASGTNVAAVRNVASNNVASECGVKDPLCQTVFQEMRLQKRYSVAGTKVLH